MASRKIHVAHGDRMIAVALMPGVPEATPPAGRPGSMVMATITEMDPPSMTMSEVSNLLVGMRIAGRHISGVEMFCLDQRVGMTVGLLLAEADNDAP